MIQFWIDPEETISIQDKESINLSGIGNEFSIGNEDFPDNLY